MVSNKDCQRRYDRIKLMLEMVCEEIATKEASWITGSGATAGDISTLWDLKTRYSIEKVHMEAEFKKILKGTDD